MTNGPQSVPSNRRATPSAVNVSRAERIFEVVWEDGHVSRFKTTDLRSLCDCANCREDREKKEDQPARGRSLPVLGSADRAEIASVNHVGRYAFGVGWKDGHQSIYTYDFLFASCPCDLCTAPEGDDQRSI